MIYQPPTNSANNGTPLQQPNASSQTLFSKARTTRSISSRRLRNRDSVRRLRVGWRGASTSSQRLQMNANLHCSHKHTKRPLLSSLRHKANSDQSICLEVAEYLRDQSLNPLGITKLIATLNILRSKRKMIHRYSTLINNTTTMRIILAGQIKDMGEVESTPSNPITDPVPNANFR